MHKRDPCGDLSNGQGQHRGDRRVGLALSACSGIRDHRGFVLDPKLAEGIQVGVDNKESVAKTLGRPTFTGQFDPNDWYYVSRDTAQLAFRDPG